MKILQFMGKGRVEIREIAKPDPDDNHVIIKVMASALCGSELSFLKNGVSDKLHNPGHEVAGIIESAPQNSIYKPGMRIGACVVQGCGQCEFCRAACETACKSKKFYSSDAHAEYFKLGLNGVRVLPDDINWPEAVVLSGDGLGVPARAARRLGDTSGKHVLVLGLGPVGLGNIMVQAFNNAKVMGADFVSYRTELAKKIGAERIANLAEQDLEKEVTNWTEGRGADIVILAAGKEAALHSAVKIVRHQGTIFQVAEFFQANINPSAMFVEREITMTGSWYYTSKDWGNMLDYYRRKLPISKLITHVLPFEKSQEAFDIFSSGNSGKVILKYY
jgi:threonine dehydrogenase-like Zn-dependent dehydrogenase